jgi:hypothetical protein
MSGKSLIHLNLANKALKTYCPLSDPTYTATPKREAPMSHPPVTSPRSPSNRNCCLTLSKREHQRPPYHRTAPSHVLWYPIRKNLRILYFLCCWIACSWPKFSDRSLNKEPHTSKSRSTMNLCPLSEVSAIAAHQTPKWPKSAPRRKGSISVSLQIPSFAPMPIMDVSSLSAMGF